VRLSYPVDCRLQSEISPLEERFPRVPHLDIRRQANPFQDVTSGGDVVGEGVHESVAVRQFLNGSAQCCATRVGTENAGAIEVPQAAGEDLRSAKGEAIHKYGYSSCVDFRARPHDQFQGVVA
jgi:hypothetical protein